MTIISKITMDLQSIRYTDMSSERSIVIVLQSKFVLVVVMELWKQLNEKSVIQEVAVR